MKLKAKQKLHQLPLPELQTEFAKNWQDLSEAKLKLASGKEKNVHLYKLKRQQLAIIKTILRQKEAAQNESINRTENRITKGTKVNKRH